MQKIGRYEIVEELGRGSMGAVFKARDPQIGRTVAIKIILTANLPKEENDLYRSRFYREAQAAGQMSHPGIVTIHDIAEDDHGQPFLVMEYVEGETLHKMLRPNEKGKLPERMPLDQALDLSAQVAEALDYAHARGVVHRDIKPGNIIVTPDGRTKIADFGIARLSGTEATYTATVTGTPAYMSPEQFRGGTIDKRSDIFSLGAMLYWMTTGEKPFPGDNVTQVSFNVVYREPAPPRQLVPGLPADLDVVLSRCLAKRTEHRYATAGETAADLRAIREGKGVGATHAPAEATVEDTVVTMPHITPVGSATARSAAKSADSSRNKIIVATIGLLAVLAAGAWFWKSASSGQTDQAGVKESSIPSTQPDNSGSPAKSAKSPGDAAGATSSTQPAPAGADDAKQLAGTKAASGQTSGAKTDMSPEPAATTSSSPSLRKGGPSSASAAKLGLECRHNFKSGTIEVSENGKIIFSGDLKEKTAFHESVPVRQGKHKFTVRVTSIAAKYAQEKTIEEEFAAGQTRTLEITFGKMSAFSRNLTLKWKK